METGTKYIMDMFGVTEDIAKRMVSDGFRTGAAAENTAANMFYEDSGLNSLMAKAKNEVDDLKAKEGLKDGPVDL